MTSSELLSLFEQLDLHNVEHRPLESYPAPRLQPELYPGEWPSDWDEYVVTPDGVMRLDLDTDPTNLSSIPDLKLHGGEQSLSLDEYLKATNLPGVEERFPILAYGSNRCPGQLLDKFAAQKFRDRPDLKIIPAIKSTISGMDVVYNAKPGGSGYFFAELYNGPETHSTTLDVVIILLTWEQLQTIHGSESAYGFGDLQSAQVTLGADFESDKPGLEIPAYVYAGPTEVFAVEDGTNNRTPVAIAEISAHGRKLPTKSQQELQQAFLDRDPEGAKQRAMAEVSGDPTIEPTQASYIKYMSMRRAGGVSSLDQRKAFQAQLKAAMNPSESMPIDLRTAQGFVESPKSTPVLMSMAEIAIAHPRGQGWWHKLG